MELTKAQKEVLELITKEYLTVKKISIRRKTTVQAVYKVVKELKKAGYLTVYNEAAGRGGIGFKPFIKGVSDFKPTFPIENLIRLHRQEFNIKLLTSSSHYEAQRQRKNKLSIDENTIILYPSSLEVYSAKEFLGKTAIEATANSFIYWNYFFNRLENELKVSIVKDRRHNIKLVNSHYAETNNELAKECNIKAERIKIQAQDGKIWFIIDNSFNLNEAETIHPQTSLKDMQETVKPFFNDLRSNSPPLPSEVWAILSQTASYQKELAASLNIVMEMIKPKPIQEDKTKADYFG